MWVAFGVAALLVVVVILMGQPENARSGQSNAGQGSSEQSSAGQHRAQGLGHGLDPGPRGMVEP